MLYEDSIAGSAEFSDCLTYRYALHRYFHKIDALKPVLFIMLNPSTADAFKDDPTIRRCISFAKREGYGSLTVVNLFALRATDPKELAKHHDPVGIITNDAVIKYYAERTIDSGGIVVAAWGSHKFAQDRAEQVSKMIKNKLCLGTTKNGSPRHPLYVKSEQELIKYELP